MTPTTPTPTASEATPTIPEPVWFEDLVGEDHRVDVAVNEHLGPVVYLGHAPLTARRAREVARFLLVAADAVDDLELETSASAEVAGTPSSVSPEVSDEVTRQFLDFADALVEGLERAPR